MKNSIRISLEFSFRGETLSPTAVIDLDAKATDAGEPDWYAILAASAGIDTYSYAYEVMQQAELVFSDATGLAAQHLGENGFNFQGFIAAREQGAIIQQLEEIVEELLDVDEANLGPALRDALLRAYQLGKSAI